MRTIEARDIASALTEIQLNVVYDQRPISDASLIFWTAMCDVMLIDHAPVTHLRMDITFSDGYKMAIVDGLDAIRRAPELTNREQTERAEKVYASLLYMLLQLRHADTDEPILSPHHAAKLKEARRVA